jgi:hypothetical protein
LRTCPHDSGPLWVAHPFSVWLFHPLHLAGLSRRVIGHFIHGGGGEGEVKGERGAGNSPSTPPPGREVSGWRESGAPRDSGVLDGDTTPCCVENRDSKVAVEGLSSAGLELAPLVVHRHPDQLPGRRWLSCGGGLRPRCSRIRVMDNSSVM